MFEPRTKIDPSRKKQERGPFYVKLLIFICAKFINNFFDVMTFQNAHFVLVVKVTCNFQDEQGSCGNHRWGDICSNDCNYNCSSIGNR